MTLDLNHSYRPRQTHKSSTKAHTQQLPDISTFSL